MRCLALRILIEDFALAHPRVLQRYQGRLARVFRGLPPVAKRREPQDLKRLVRREVSAHLVDLTELAALGLLEAFADPADREAELAAWGFGPAGAKVVRLPPRGRPAPSDGRGTSVVLRFPSGSKRRHG